MKNPTRHPSTRFLPLAVAEDPVAIAAAVRRDVAQGVPDVLQSGAYVRL